MSRPHTRNDFAGVCVSARPAYHVAQLVEKDLVNYG